MSDWNKKHPEKARESRKKWRDAHPDYMKKYRENHPNCRKNEYNKAKKERLLYMEQYIKTQIGRASNLASAYKQNDTENNRGESTLTKEWIVENIFSKPCHYCGESDWTKLGCDRIDNSKPHTPENVVPCCFECNRKRKNTPYDEYLKKVGK